MLVFDDFQETGQVQATVYTPSFIFSTSKILKKLMELTPDMFEGEPTILPLPDDAPHEIPRVTLESKEKMYKLEVAPARINFFRIKIKKEDQVEPREFVQKAGETLTGLLDGIGANCGRIAAVIKYVIRIKIILAGKLQATFVRIISSRNHLIGPVNSNCIL